MARQSLDAAHCFEQGSIFGTGVLSHQPWLHDVLEKYSSSLSKYKIPLSKQVIHMEVSTDHGT